MNRISFNGSSEVIGDFADRFLDGSPGPFQPLEETEEIFGDLLADLAGSEDTDLRYLEKVVDFLVANDLPEKKIRSLITDRPQELVELANDARILEEYLLDGTITGVQVVKQI